MLRSEAPGVSLEELRPTLKRLWGSVETESSVHAGLQDPRCPRRLSLLSRPFGYCWLSTPNCRRYTVKPSEAR